MDYSSRIVFWSSCFGMLLFGISLITLGSVVIPLAEKFSLNQVDAGTLFFIMPFGILTGSLVFGPLCDRYGYKVVLITSCVCMFIGIQGIAWTTSIPMLRLWETDNGIYNCGSCSK